MMLINKLNTLGFGLDIDSLESYIIDYNQSKYLTDLSLYEPNYKQLYELLNSLKPESTAFSVNNLISTNMETEDVFFIRDKNPRKKVIYGMHDLDGLKALKDSIDSTQKDLVDMISILNVRGLDVKCVYKYGELRSVSLIGECNKYTDITKQVYIMETLPMEIEELGDYWVTELRGKLTIFNNEKELQSISKHVETSVMRCIRCNIYRESLNIVFNDIKIMEDEGDDKTIKSFNNEWEKIEFMRKLELSVPHHGMLRGIDSDSIEEALYDMCQFFDKIGKTTGIVYPFKGFEIRISEAEPVIYNTTDVSSEQMFVSTVKSFKHLGNFTNQLIIVLTQCNEQLAISKIDIDDIYLLEELGIHKGSSIVFNVIEGKAVLNKEYTAKNNPTPN